MYFQEILDVDDSAEGEIEMRRRVMDEMRRKVRGLGFSGVGFGCRV